MCARRLFLILIQTITMVNVLILIILISKIFTGGSFPLASNHHGNVKSNLRPRSYNGPRCKTSPQDSEWPTKEEWQQLNKTVDGRLLQPSPAPSVCYPSHSNYNSTTCAFLTSGAAKATRFWLDDPLSVLYPWTEGNTCLPITINSTNQERECTQGGFPVYVVNATQPEHIQAQLCQNQKYQAHY
ncbi:hypothetical protein QBC38DRAFT_494156 [Podospora fimiseda]|uniref:Uncharacterized protein n=1 Tax=Podospora fimiseda TaxID=252190 RepID=A0AAN7BC93_9PEZI|nr:hypothetical protein QBC38DRAFT_494156 [Podospora fimiseda]